jgi:uncharacterized protein YjiS (DUF1127 family)
MMIQGNINAAQRSHPLDQARRARGAVGRLLVSWVKRLIAWFETRRRMRRAVDELMALDDRMLRDIGVSRGEILYAARYGRERDK